MSIEIMVASLRRNRFAPSQAPDFAERFLGNRKHLNEATQAGWGAWIRTRGWRNQNPLPYHLASPQNTAGLPPLAGLWASPWAGRRADHSGATIANQLQ